MKLNFLGYSAPVKYKPAAGAGGGQLLRSFFSNNSPSHCGGRRFAPISKTAPAMLRTMHCKKPSAQNSNNIISPCRFARAACIVRTGVFAWQDEARNAEKSCSPQRCDSAFCIVSAHSGARQYAVQLRRSGDGTGALKIAYW